MECNGVSPFAGERYFVVGGLCESSERAEVSQEIDLATWRDQIENQELYVTLEAHARNWEGSDIPELGLTFLDAEGETLMGEARAQTIQEEWTQLRVSHLAPPSATKAKITLYGTRISGSDNDSYFDEIKAYINMGVSLCDPPPEAQTLPDGDTDMGVSPMIDMDIALDRPDMELGAERDLSMANTPDQDSDQGLMLSESGSDMDDGGCAAHSAKDHSSSHSILLIMILALIRGYRRDQGHRFYIG
jgi:hypothetical protein